MFGLVSKKKYVAALAKIKVLEFYTEKQEEKIQVIEDNEIELYNRIREIHKEYGDIITKIGIKEETLIEEIKGLKQKNTVTKATILKEVRKRLIQELTEFKKRVSKEKFKKIDSSGYVKVVNKLEEAITGLEIMRCDLMEGITDDLIKDIDKHIEEVGDEIFE